MCFDAQSRLTPQIVHCGGDLKCGGTLARNKEGSLPARAEAARRKGGGSRGRVQVARRGGWSHFARAAATHALTFSMLAALRLSNSTRVSLKACTDDGFGQISGGEGVLLPP